MKCAHLFNGIGGFALAAHWMGWENYMHCEIDPFCNKVMNKHFSNSIQHEDIRETDFTSYRGTIDLLTGGWPCHPVSTAGKRLGKSDVRYLWPHNIRAVREIQPCWVVGENVRGLTNWEGGVLFDEVQADLETEGYEVLPFLLPAAGVNAPHRRDRIWFIAYGANAGLENLRRKREDSIFEPGIITDASSEGLSIGLQSREYGADQSTGAQQGSESARTFPTPGWEEFPTQSPVCDRNDGLSNQLVDITFSKWRNESIKALGNAIVPQVAFQIFKAIEQYNAL